MKKTIYSLTDSFLVESDKPRSIDQLNLDRHLFVENMEHYIFEQQQKVYRAMVNAQLGILTNEDIELLNKLNKQK